MVYRKDILAHAYACCRANQGAAGADGQRFEDIEDYGRERSVAGIREFANVKTVWV